MGTKNCAINLFFFSYFFNWYCSRELQIISHQEILVTTVNIVIEVLTRFRSWRSLEMRWSFLYNSILYDLQFELLLSSGVFFSIFKLSLLIWWRRGKKQVREKFFLFAFVFYYLYSVYFKHFMGHFWESNFWWRPCCCCCFCW